MISAQEFQKYSTENWRRTKTGFPLVLEDFREGIESGEALPSFHYGSGIYDGLLFEKTLAQPWNLKAMRAVEASFRGCYFRGIDLNGSFFDQCDFEGASFEGCSLLWTALYSCNFKNARVQGCKIDLFKLEDCDFRGMLCQDCWINWDVPINSLAALPVIATPLKLILSVTPWMSKLFCNGSVKR